ncbi:molybdenum cofactor guanylyltransferase MobA [Shinella zoogloeoides]|uniref:Molybdenum cofactor guanylyltransferase n=1 Tax=Shinella zoogloeoides TaxID=352475 RepID=A0A6N8T6U3_SHIZO|nr:molybdenum cofactor guanylyltransferase MobA [Shinella zoogloeoides]MXN98992.1 molybdenum cofactor guanylyltransferase [Shinella zoogloeoides]UEX83429.1 molybdenum cofactor guanylyltransferase [Shinella zoogloeoides]
MALNEAIPGVILAGGLSSRMGQDKAGLRLGGTALIDRAARRLRPQVSALAVNANGPVLFAPGEDLPVFADLDATRSGPLGGVLAVLDHARRFHPETSHIATVPTDSPFFPADLVARLAEAVDTPERIVHARSAHGPHPVFALWPVALTDDLAAWLAGGGALRMRSYMDRHRAQAVDFPPVGTIEGDLDPFFNINTPDDLKAAETWLRVLER